jgi:CRISPR system Cascade subunit CasA
MRTIYNLLDEPFLPCLSLDGSRVVLSLSEVFERAPQLRALFGDSPIQTAALLRFLLAVLYSCLALETEERWKILALAGAFPLDRISQYLTKWRPRFDLFDPERPFYQTPGLEKYFVPIQKLFPERAAGNNDTLFDHTHEDSAFSVEPAAAARGLITLQAFAVGGLVSFEQKEDRSASGGALATGMFIAISGANLFETLLRSLSRYDPANGEPMPVTNGDRPAWERMERVLPRDRFPDGLRDYLTFQSRRLLLRPDVDKKGGIRCDGIAILKGEQLDPGWSLRDRDPYVAFRRFEKATTARDQWLPLGLDPDRAVWRDSAALFAPRKKDSNIRSPYHFKWLSRLSGSLFELPQFELIVIGQATDQATILLWREERLILPRVFLTQDQYQYNAELQNALEIAETSARLLRQSIRNVLDKLGVNTKKGTPHLSQAQLSYWSGLEISFRKFLTDLAAVPSHEDGDFHGQHLPALEFWKESVRTAAKRSYEGFANSLSAGARTLAALAIADRFLAGRLSVQKKIYLPQERIDA